MNTNLIKCPLNNSTNVRLEKEIDCQTINDIYQQWLKINVEKYFQGINTIKIYQCLETGYFFYHPFNLEGDSSFYEALQVFPWYYVDWKWEFEITDNLINPHDRVLEIGCGKGAFIEYLQNKKIDCLGLELNKDAIEVAKNKKLNINYQTIQEHSELKSNYYDIVCSFQVLEHITFVRDFIKASIKALKVGGKLVLCVPNNDSFVKYEKHWVTNMPPHHMGLWNEKSLRSLTKLFDLKLNKIYFEPLNTYEWYYNIQIQRIMNVLDGHKFPQRIVKKSSQIAFKPSLKLIKHLRHFIPGHSILAVYTKVK